MSSNQYLQSILQKYKCRDLNNYIFSIAELKTLLKEWASSCFIETKNSGSRAKWTAISRASDVDYFVSLSSWCNENNGWLSGIYDSLYNKLNSIQKYKPVRKQNVSFRIKLGDLEVDITPWRKQPWITNNHSIFVSKKWTWQQTNIDKHISDISTSWRTDEIKLLKIWRELNWLDFPSIYMEYLMVQVMLYNKTKGVDYLADNMWHILWELAKDNWNPLYTRIIDPANSSNILSDLLTNAEKSIIISKAKTARTKKNWSEILY